MPAQQDSAKMFLEAIASVPADSPTACTDWTAHHVAAHLAAGFEEVNVLIEDSLAGRPSRETRAFDEREAPYLIMDSDSLRNRLREHLVMTTKVLADFQAAGANAVFEFNGATFTAAQMTTHFYSELAIHRWDLVGDDATSEELLSIPAYTHHAVFLLNALPMLAEAPTNRIAGNDLLGTTVVLRSPDRPDVALQVNPDGAAHFVQGDDEVCLVGDFIVTTDAANRLLTLWGRRSSRHTISITGNPARWDAVAAALWPNAHPWPQPEGPVTRAR